ncbi:hypothetical protein [Xanthobacter flavus]|uniref:hypothetical protein n=1 Tax=Xanthobacter flavus TaxID=281 RepID=UPI0037276A34
MSHLPRGPYKVVDHAESFEVVDADGYNIAYVYFDLTNDEVSRRVRRRLTKAQSRAIVECLLSAGCRASPADDALPRR